MKTKVGVKDSLTLDLHGAYHEDVKGQLDRFLYEHMLNANPAVKVITGKSEKMKEIVGDILSEYGFEYKEDFLNSGSITVFIR